MPKKKPFLRGVWGLRGEGRGSCLPQHSLAVLQAWLTEIHEYAQKDVVIMLLGNKVRAGSPFTPWFAVPCRAVLCWSGPTLAIPVAVEGWGSLGALPAGWVYPACTLRSALLISGLSQAQR